MKNGKITVKIFDINAILKVIKANMEIELNNLYATSISGLKVIYAIYLKSTAKKDGNLKNLGNSN